MQWLEELAQLESGRDITIVRVSGTCTVLMGVPPELPSAPALVSPWHLTSATLDAAVEGLLREYANKSGGEAERRFEQLPPPSA
jgi:hypothetical protein